MSDEKQIKKVANEFNDVRTDLTKAALCVTALISLLATMCTTEIKGEISTIPLAVFTAAFLGLSYLEIRSIKKNKDLPQEVNK